MIKLLLFILILMLSKVMSFAQYSDNACKERGELINELQHETTQIACKEAKRMKKAGWKTTPHALPLDKQLGKSYLMQCEYNEDKSPKYIMGEAVSVGEDYDTAKMLALELAKQNLAGQLQTQMNAFAENVVSINQLTQEQTSIFTQSIQSSMSLISQYLGQIIPVVEIYRIVSNGNTEVLIRIACDSQKAWEGITNAIQEDLEGKDKNLYIQSSKLFSL